MTGSERELFRRRITMLLSPNADKEGHLRLGIHEHTLASRAAFGLLTGLEEATGGQMLGDDIVITIDAEAILQK